MEISATPRIALRLRSVGESELVDLPEGLADLWHAVYGILLSLDDLADLVEPR